MFALILIDMRKKLMPYIEHYGSMDDVMEFVKTMHDNRQDFVILPLETPKREYSAWPLWAPSVKGHWPSYPLIKIVTKPSLTIVA